MPGAEEAREIESTFRTANRDIAAVARDLNADALVPFLCECSEPACRAVVRMPWREYAAIHEHPHRFTSVEPIGGPVQSPFTCPPGASCGSATFSGLGHATSDVIVFNNACGPGCNIRTVTFDDGSTLLIAEQIVGISSPGNYGGEGYGNVHFIQITQTIVGDTGRFAGATGSGSGTVTGAGGGAVVSASGTITLP